MTAGFDAARKINGDVASRRGINKVLPAASRLDAWPRAQDRWWVVLLIQH